MNPYSWDFSAGYNLLRKEKEEFKKREMEEELRDENNRTELRDSYTN